MDKYLFNNTDYDIKISSLGIVLEEHNEYEIPYEMIHVFVENTELIELIQTRQVQVGTAGSIIADPAEGEAFFRTMLGDQAFVSDGELVTRFDNIAVTDPWTGKKAVTLFMNMLTMMRDLYNNTDNPVYLEGHSPILGEGGWAEQHAIDLALHSDSIEDNNLRLDNFDSIHAKLGWHNQEIYSYGKGRPRDLLIYYGYMNSFNSAVNGWDNEKVAQDMAKYSMIVLGDGTADPEHPDYANAVIIIARVKVLNPATKIFGYISASLKLSVFQGKAEAWDASQIHGIFMDEAGYDYGSFETNGREAFNEKVVHIHGLINATLCFVNAWNMDHIIGVVNDPAFPNEEFNHYLVPSSLVNSDWYLLESFAVNTLSYDDGIAPAIDWAARGVKAQQHRATYGINLASIGIINDDNPQGAELFKFCYVSALMWSLEANGSSSNYYGAGTAQVAYWERASVSDMGRLWNLNASVQSESASNDLFLRYVDHGRFELSFKPPSGKITKY